MATVSKIREWMDNQIKANELMNEVIVVEKHDDGIDDKIINYRAEKSEVHIGGESVRYISKRLDLDLCVKARKNDKENPYEVFVIYKGYSFFGIETEDEYRDRGAVV